jgi:hypothetical protein
MRRRLGRIAFIVAILGTLVAVDTGEAPASTTTGASISDIGWWSRTPSTTTPAGGFQIAKGPDGDTSIAAVRIAIDGSLTQALLILSETAGGFLQDSAVIDACPTVEPWTAAVAGALAEAPKGDCARKVPVERNATTGNWTIDLLPLIEPGASSLAVVLRPGAVTAVVAPTPPTIPSPAPSPVPVPAVPAAPVPPVPTPVDPGFTIEFSKAEVFAGGPEAPSDSGPSGSASGTGTIASGGGTTTFAPTFSFEDSFASTTDFASVTPSRDALPAATPSVAASGAGGVGTAASVESGLQPVAASSGPGAPWGRLLILVPLSFAIGAIGAGVRRTVAGRSVVGAVAN